MDLMPLAPKPQPPKGRRRCNCRTCCTMRDLRALTDAYRTVIARSYTPEEFRALTRASKAAMLPRDSSS